MSGNEQGRQPGPGPDDPVSPSGLVEKGTNRFAGRRWAFQRVTAWMLQPDTRFFVLTGEPGVGKSALAAWMAGHGPLPTDADGSSDLAAVRAHWSAVHFCRAKAGGTLDPKTFAASVSRQLATRHAAFAELALRHLAPEIRITQTIGDNRGLVVGIAAEQVIVNSRDAEDVYDKAVRKPLRDLARTRPGLFPVFLLVDGLDEAWGRAEPNIVTLLEHSEDLPEGVHVVLTTRHLPLVLERLADRTQLDLSAGEFSAESDEDIRTYVEGRLGEADLMPQAAALANRWEVVDRLVAAADGNFLFAEFLLDEAAGRPGRLEDPAGTPRGLYPLYRHYLDRLLPALAKPGGADAWASTYRPLLGTLSVATPSAPEPALPRWLAWRPEEVDLRLGEVRQLWEESGGVGTADHEYRVYHRSLADFLATRDYLDGKVSTRNRYYAPPAAQHERIADYYMSVGAGTDGDWTASDPYGLRQVVPHLRAWLDLENEPRRQSDIARRLYDVVLDPGLKAEQERRLGGVGATTTAFRIAIEAALRRNEFDVAGELVTILASDLDAELRALGREFLQRIQATDPGLFDRMVKRLLV